MFVGGEVRAEVAFVLAQARLARFAQAGGLLAASQGAYGAGLAGLVPAGPPGSLPHPAGLVRVRFGDLIARGTSAYAPLRWEAIALDSGLFPALDADLTLRAAGEEATTVSLTGVYRLPPGTWGDGLGHPVVHRVATATIQAFLNRVAAALTTSGPAAEGDGGTTDRGGFPPAAQAP
jgi:hypothetical protein